MEKKTNKQQHISISVLVQQGRWNWWRTPRAQYGHALTHFAAILEHTFMQKLK